MDGAAQVHDAVHQRRHNDQQAERQVGEKHGLVKRILQLSPLHHCRQ